MYGTNSRHYFQEKYQQGRAVPKSCSGSKSQRTSTSVRKVNELPKPPLYPLWTPITMTVVFTSNYILRFGLELKGYDSAMQARVQRTTCVRRFKSFYGSNAIVYASLWEDLQKTKIKEARMRVRGTGKKQLKHMLMALYFLRAYPTEERQAAIFHVSDRTVRTATWKFIAKISALFKDKVYWPKKWRKGHPEVNGEDVPTFLLTVDGVHCRVSEAKTVEYKKMYSHKFHQAAFDYEIGLSVYESRLVWVNGPFPASFNDISIFRMGLKQKIPRGKLIIADNGYRGEARYISTPNPSDPKELRMFKGRARARQESFNARLKSFQALGQRFRHRRTKHQAVFFAICVIIQYQFESGSPLFDI
jgi:hypothetical protein